MLNQTFQKTLIKKHFKNILFLSIFSGILFVNTSKIAFSQAEKSRTNEERISDLEEIAKASKNLKLSGYIQAQFLSASVNGAKTFSGANFPSQDHNIFMIRRGRFKADYKSSLANYCLQIDANDKGVSLKDAYVDVKEPFFNIFSLRVGMQKVIMGNEIIFSSVNRLSPERARVTQVLVPGERDLGAMLAIQAPKKHFLNPITLSLELVCGNGINSENDNQKNFVARLLYDKKFKLQENELRFSIGGSTYQGGVYQGDSAVYKMNGNKFESNKSAENIGKQAERTYYAAELLLAYKSPLGLTSLNGEFWTGNQAGSLASSQSPSTNTLPNYATYIRPFSGALAQISHEITNTNLAIALKYDFYNPNTKVAGNEIGLAGSSTSATDLAYTTFGSGLIYSPTKNLRFTIWYDIVSNETSENLANFKEDLKDNVLNLRMQVGF